MGLILHLHVLEAVGAGGLETRLETIRRLDPGVEQIIAAPSWARELITAFWGGGIAELPFHINSTLTIAQATKFAPWLRKVTAGYERVVLHSHTPLAAILLAITAIPNIIHAHTLHGPEWLPWQGKGERIYQAILGRTTDHLISVSEEMTDRACALLTQRPVLTLSNASALLHPTSRASGLPTVSTKSGAIAFAGRLDRNKAEGLEALFALLTKLDNGPRLDVFGDGPLRTKLEALAVPLGSRVRFHGTDMSFASRIRDFDLIAGEGRVALEALAAGVPTLVCAARLSGFVTIGNLARLLYANAALRGMGQAAPITAAALIDPPLPPALPAAPPVPPICRKLETQTPYTEARLALANRVRAVMRSYGGTCLHVLDALDYVSNIGDPW